MTVYGSCGDEEVSPMSAALVFLLCFALLVGWEVLCLGGSLLDLHSARRHPLPSSRQTVIRQTQMRTLAFQFL